MDQPLQTLSHVGTSPSRALLRRLIRELLRTDADLNAFCQDYFPFVHERYSLGMDRLSKVNLLLELSDPGTIALRLKEQLKTSQERGIVYETVVNSWKRPEEEKSENLRDELEGLYREREVRRLHGLKTNDVDSQIVEIKRIQRQVPKLQEGEVLADRYRLLEVIGRGGFANVWQAMDRASRRLVAVKVLHIEQGDESRRIERFIRGARQMRNLTHPNIVRVLDGPAEYHGFHFFVMDFVFGGDLHHAIISRIIGRSIALNAILQVGSALDFAHQNGLVHRDVKPHNILLDETKQALLTDFDLVWAPDSTGGTRTGAMGTFLYAAPEEMEDASRVDKRVDVYSLAMSTVFVLYGKGLPRQVLDSRAIFIDRLNCPEPVKALLRRATASDPEDRPSTATDFCAELQRAWPFLRHPQQNDPTVMSITSNAPPLPLITTSGPRTDEIPLLSTSKTFSPTENMPWQSTDRVESLENINMLKSLPRKSAMHPFLRWLAVPIVILILIISSYGIYERFMMPEIGVLEVITEPEGAQVQVDNKVLNERTPVKINGGIGSTAQIRLVLSGYDTYEGKIIFTADARPLRVHLFKIGQRQQLTITNPFSSSTATLVEDDQENVIDSQNSKSKVANQKSDSQKLTITVRPWAIIYIDGKKIQQTPMRYFPIKTGRHKIALENSNKGKREIISITVKPDQEIPPINRIWD